MEKGGVIGPVRRIEPDTFALAFDPSVGRAVEHAEQVLHP